MILPRFRVVLLAVVLLFHPLSQVMAAGPLVKVSSSSLPNFTPEGSLENFKLSLRRQLATCARQNAGATWSFENRVVSRREWCTETNQKYLEIANRSASLAEVFVAARAEFDWYRSVGRDGNGDVGFTGYNFPTLTGTSSKTAANPFPIYSKPSDLVEVTIDGSKTWRRRLPNGRLVLYHDREAIDVGGALRGKGLELAYTPDLFSVFVLQVQGAGAVVFKQPDGSQRRVILNYAAQNGHKYTSLRSVLQAQGVDPEYLTLPGMRRYFNENPSKLVPTLNRNRSYVFFKESAEGPYGVDNILLTPEHSIAVDLKVFPVGAVSFIATQKPIVRGQEVLGWEDFGQVVVTQDTGGAIRGAGRVDIYWGEDHYAEMAAGTMDQRGSLYLSVVKK